MNKQIQKNFINNFKNNADIQHKEIITTYENKINEFLGKIKSKDFEIKQLKNETMDIINDYNHQIREMEIDKINKQNTKKQIISNLSHELEKEKGMNKMFPIELQNKNEEIDKLTIELRQKIPKSSPQKFL